MYVVTAFLNRELDEKIYMEVPNSVCKFVLSGSSGRYWREILEVEEVVL